MCVCKVRGSSLGGGGCCGVVKGGGWVLKNRAKKGRNSRVREDVRRRRVKKKEETSSTCPSSCPIALKTVRSDDCHLLPPSLLQLPPPLCTFLGLALFIVFLSSALPPSKNSNTPAIVSLIDLNHTTQQQTYQTDKRRGTFQFSLLNL